MKAPSTPGRSPAKFICLALFALLPAFAFGNDALSFGAVTRLGAVFPQLFDSARPMEPSAFLSSFVMSGGDEMEARLSLEVAAAGGAARLGIGESWVRWYPGDYVSLSAGRYALGAGCAIFLANLALFSPFDPIAAISINDPGLSTQLEVAVLGANAHAKLVWAPSFLDANTASIDPLSPYFPTTSIPREITYGGRTYVRGEILALPPAAAPHETGDFLIELGLTAGSLSTAIILYDGVEREPVAVPTLVIRGSLSTATSYDLLLEPRIGRSQVLGFCGSTSLETRRVGGFVLGIEGALRIGRSAVAEIFRPRFEYEGPSEQLVYYIETGEYSTVEELASTVTLTWAPPVSTLFAFAEYRSLDRPWASPRVAGPAFARVMLGGFRLKAFDKLEALIAAAWSIDGGGVAFVPRVSLELPGDLSLVAVFPLFFGANDSEFGQYAGIRRLSLSFEARF